MLVLNSCKPKGCMDPSALNFDPEAKVYDGSCEYGELKTELILDFQMKAGNEHISIDEEFNDNNGHEILVSKFQFYVSNIAIESASGTKQLAEIGLVDLDTAASENPEAPKWYPSLEFDIDPGMYTGVAFDIGVPANLNKIDPTLYAADQALSITPNLYWGWQSMYIFVKIEGQFDRDGDGEIETPFFFHTGLDELFIDLPAFAASFEIVENQKKKLVVNLDVVKLFGQIDMNNYYQSHTVIEDPVTGALSADTASIIFTESLSTSFSLVSE